MQTAAAVADALGTEPVALPALREVALGEWEGKTSAQLAEEYPERWEAWVRHPSWDLVPQGEGAKPFETRVRNAVYELLERHPQGDVLCVTHGGVIQVVLGEATRRASDGPFPFVIDNCSLTVLQQTRRGLVITSVNDTCHLADGEGPPRPP